MKGLTLSFAAKGQAGKVNMMDNADIIPKFVDYNRLQRLRRHAAKHGLAVLRGCMTDSFTVATTGTDRLRGVRGLIDVPLDAVEAALPAPSPPAKREVTDVELDRLINRVGAARFRAALDRLTAPRAEFAAE
jgi:hypothetical protein